MATGTSACGDKWPQPRALKLKRPPACLEGRESDIMTVLFAAQKRLRVAGLFRRRYVAVTCAFALCLLLLAHKGTGNAEPETTHGRYVSALRHVAVSCHGNLACSN